MSFPNLSALAVRERAVTLFFLILSILAGVYAFGSLGRAEDPAFTVRVMVVSAMWPGASTEQMQSQVADRLERRIQEVENLNKIETTIRPGRVDLQIEFHDYTPGDKVPTLFYEVRKRMWDEATRMPKGVIGPMANDDFADVYFSLMALTAPGLPMRELTLQAEAIRDRLQRIDGLQKALVLGERAQRVFVDFDMATLNNLGLSPQVVFDAIDANNQLVPAGLIELNGPRAYLRLDADLSDPERLAAVPIRVGQRLIRLGDIATITQGYEDPPSYLVRSRGQDALLLGVVMQKGEDGLAFGERLAAFVADEQARLPLGMELQRPHQSNRRHLQSRQPVSGEVFGGGAGGHGREHAGHWLASRLGGGHCRAAYLRAHVFAHENHGR
jgi:multidrug efflux pump subunit AcrB